jgi:1-deoxy-D-xylulose 5-phosphate reductoisomerase
MKRVIVCGATGSVGGNTLAVLRDHPDKYRVVGLVAGKASVGMAALAREFPDAAVAVGENKPIPALDRDRPGAVFAGENAPLRLLAETDADVCVAAVSGTAGLRLAFAAAAKGITILLANKEVLVSAGTLFLDAVGRGGSTVLPLDSEHTALWQCLDGHAPEQVRSVIITASGGPFRTWSSEQMKSAAPADALRHPVWRMGAKISVDSATLANKALELIEAHHLFSLPFERMEALIHPQSAIHGLVEFVDGSLLAHMGVCDMRQPIATMLAWPERRENALPRFDLAAVGRLDFSKPDMDRFPMLRLGIRAGQSGGVASAMYNAANEAAVLLFLAEKISFADIAGAVEYATKNSARTDVSSLDEVEDVHREARSRVREFALHKGIAV